MGDALRADGPPLALRFDPSPEWDTSKVALPDITKGKGGKGKAITTDQRKRKVWGQPAGQIEAWRCAFPAHLTV
jgi:hypothetical protein